MNKNLDQKFIIERKKQSVSVNFNVLMCTISQANKGTEKSLLLLKLWIVN